MTVSLRHPSEPAGLPTAAVRRMIGQADRGEQPREAVRCGNRASYRKRLKIRAQNIKKLLSEHKRRAIVDVGRANADYRPAARLQILEPSAMEHRLTVVAFHVVVRPDL